MACTNTHTDRHTSTPIRTHMYDEYTAVHRCDTEHLSLLNAVRELYSFKNKLTPVNCYGDMIR